MRSVAKPDRPRPHPLSHCLACLLLLVMHSDRGALAQTNASYDDDFAGVIGRTRDESTPDWPQRPTPPEGAPNVLVWLLDDAGFAHLSPYGGLTETPTIQRLADTGLVYTDFHSIPLCAPARAALLSGRNHHSVAFGSHVMTPAGYPGYNGVIPRSAASFARILRDAGYATYAFGKWDQTRFMEASVAGPFDSWPSGQGFERFYGFVSADAHHFSPSLWSDHTPISPADGKPDYFLTTDLADKTIEFIGGLRANNQKKPFFIYWSTGAVHAPHHAPKPWIEKYNGAFDQGWDKAREQIHQRQLEMGILPEGTRLSPKRPEIPDWKDLNEQEKRLYARQMEAFAGQLEHTDFEFGRIIHYLEQIGELDNTLIIITSDNGASAEGGMAGLHNEGVVFNGRTLDFEANNRFLDDWGGPNTVNHYHAGWGMAGNTPFPFYKHHVDGGGTHVPFIMVWPKVQGKKGVRRQYHHMIDVGPTVLDAAGLTAPETVDGVPQKPMEGMSLRYSAADADAKARRTTQYYEVWGNRGIYQDGWKAATIHNNIMPWQRPYPGDLSDDVWRLYHVAEDFSQSVDLAARYPEKLRELQQAWEVEAEKYGVFPLDPDRRSRLIYQMNENGRKESVIEYRPEGAIRIPEALSPPVKNRSFSITAFVNLEAGAPAASGVIATSGGMTGGYAFYVKDGYPTYVHNVHNDAVYYVRGEEKVTEDTTSITFYFEKNADNNGGQGSVWINEKEVGSALIPETVRNTFSIEDGFDVGMDDGSSVTPEYAPPFRFSGTLDRVVFDLSGAAPTP